MKAPLCAIFLALSTPFCFSQKLENTKADALGDKIIVTYDLVEGEPGDKCSVALYASHNNYSAPLTKVTGDVGNVTPGVGRRIEWDAKAEIGKYKGTLTFEVEAKVIAAFALKSRLTTAKRGSSVPLQWRGGNQGNSVKVELLKAGQIAGTIATVTNKGSYDWKIPSKQTPGNDYSLRLSNGTETVSTEKFTIKPKFPMWLKIGVPVAIIGAVIWMQPPPCKDCGTTTLDDPPDIGLN